MKVSLYREYMMVVEHFTLFWILFKALLHCDAREAILMDTRTATSDVGWMMSQGSEWQEVSSAYPDGSQGRMLMVCQIKKPKQNNWVRTPYIPVHGASRVYVEFEFTIRSCEDVPNVATCKETFNLYYYETDHDEATTTFPPWREGAYVKVDTIAADKRFQPGSHETNFETRDIGSITSNGIYLALQDTGACMALMHLRVFYKYCTPTVLNLARFERTIAGPKTTSLMESFGTCVHNAGTEGDSNPTLYCNSDGNWDVPKGNCVCGFGFNANSDLTSCQACGRGFYKSTLGNEACQRCPAYSHSRDLGASVCDCMSGYYRSHVDTSSTPCSKPPSKPVNLQAQVNKTWVTLTWDRPLNDGGRDDLTYSIECSVCQSRFTKCSSCTSDVDYVPRQTELVAAKVKIEDLQSFNHYKFKVLAVNGVSQSARDFEMENYAIVTIETIETTPSAVLGVKITDVDSTSFVMRWEAPLHSKLGIEMYEVTVLDVNNDVIKTLNLTISEDIDVKGLISGREYTVKVRAKNFAGFGPYSAPVQLATRSNNFDPSDEQNGGSISPLQLLLAVIGGAVIVIIVVIIVYCCKKHSRKRKEYADKIPMSRTFTLKSNGDFPSTLKTYIDPTTYEDPQRAVLEFTKEIDSSRVAIEQVIGGGEFGEVCRGVITSSTKKQEYDVAIKTLKVGYSTQQKLDFLGEASIMGQFEHPNVIRLEGVVTKSRPLMIITEYMENGSLDAFLKKHDGEFSVIQMVGILRNIAAGMKYLADMGYIHRDLAARNILVNAQLICKVSDFGMSRVLEEDADATYTTRGGKIPIRWTAPEAITFRKFTSASDVWSYGIVMWEVMSYGERPYWGMSNRDVIQAVGSGFRLPAPMDCPQIQYELMNDCWKAKREERPKFAQIVMSLDRILRDPSQLKVIASESCGGHLINERGSIARFSNYEPPLDGESDQFLPQSSRAKDLIPEYSRRFLDNSLQNWLVMINLESYKDNFIHSGCSCLDQVIQLTSSDLSRMGITDADHQNIILESIGCIRGDSCKFPLSSYQESEMSGVPV